MHLTILRVAGTAESTYGVFLNQHGVPFTLTLERAWLDNAKGQSCIPDGTYVCKRVNSPKFGDTFEITEVPGRSAILFHKGNLFSDSHGCVIVGESFEPVGATVGITASTKGYEQFKELTVGLSSFLLTVKSADAPRVLDPLGRA